MSSSKSTRRFKTHVKFGSGKKYLLLNPPEGSRHRLKLATRKYFFFLILQKVQDTG